MLRVLMCNGHGSSPPARRCTWLDGPRGRRAAYAVGQRKSEDGALSAAPRGSPVVPHRHPHTPLTPLVFLDALSFPPQPRTRNVVGCVSDTQQRGSGHVCDVLTRVLGRLRCLPLNVRHPALSCSRPAGGWSPATVGSGLSLLHQTLGCFPAVGREKSFYKEVFL